jgi:FixJ family two-component response regulator
MEDQGAVLFLDDDPDLRETIIDLVQAIFDRECLGLPGYRDLVALGDRALGCSLAILDINLGPEVPSGIDAYDWLREHRFHGRIVFLTGHAGTHPLVVEASRIGDARVLTKPISFDRLKSVIQGRELQEEA